MRFFVPLFVFALIALLTTAARAAETPFQRCRRTSTDDTLRPIPALLTPAAKRLFGLKAPDQVVRRTTVFRCMDGTVLLCNAGANLPCGKANVGRRLASAERYCGEHPDAPDIPAYVTGHDTIYTWRCRGASAVGGEPTEALDGRGFMARLWKAVEWRRLATTMMSTAASASYAATST